MANIRKGDTVQVIAGKDKGTTGTVLSVDRIRARVLVEGVNRVKRHTKETTSDRGVKVGGITTVESAIHLSNVMLVDGVGQGPQHIEFELQYIQRALLQGPGLTEVLQGECEAVRHITPGLGQAVFEILQTRRVYPRVLRGPSVDALLVNVRCKQFSEAGRHRFLPRLLAGEVHIRIHGKATRRRHKAQ